MTLDENFWSKRYIEQSTGWDIGYPSDPLVDYIDTLEDKSIKILIPGAGNAYEAEHLWKLGFGNTTVIDLAREPLENLRSRIPSIPAGQLIQGNFFDHFGQYDLILEQTFFCALDPKLRPQYVAHMNDLLAPNGRLVGVLFDFPKTEQGPPFGGSREEYQELLSPTLDIKVLERCYNSIKPRQGSELFLIAEKH
ncbi:MAG: methyltransferase domain-containing protein [Flavobacteriales bacterium]|nr:methyltransferase domain-containing protein [Flavobacteriales bacterium]